MTRHRGALVPSLFVAALLFLVPPLAVQGQFLFPLQVSVPNGAGVARTAEPTTFGFPVANSAALTDLNTFRVLDAGQQPVPAQFRALTRWGGDRGDITKCLKWVQATFPATVPAGATGSFTIVTTGTPATGSLSLTQDASTITVATRNGTAFAVPKSAFTLFNSVSIGGQQMLAGPGSIEMTSPTGVPILATNVQTDIEENGTVRAVLRQTGALLDLRYTLRYYFHAGRSDVELQFRLENPNAYGVVSAQIPDGQRYFDRLWLRLPLAGAAPNATTSSAAYSLAGGRTIEIRQNFAWTSNLFDVLAGFFSTTTLSGVAVPGASRSDGAIDVSNSTAGLSVVVDRFWQQFPKALRVAGNLVQIGLWPEWGNGPAFVGQWQSPTSGPPDPNSLASYRFEGGRWKTHRVVFDFHAGGPREPLAVQALAKRVNAPLVGRVSARVLGMSNATGIVFIDRRPSYPSESFARMERFTDIMADDQAADDLGPGYGRIGLEAFKNRGGTFGGWQPYGWDNFGDIPWVDGYCDLHYDWPASMLLGYLRTGDYRLFDRGRDMVAFRRDYGQNHGQDPIEYWRGAQFYEKGWWHGNDLPGTESHNWIQGLCLAYVMTGDEGAYEAARENIQFVLRYPPGTWSGYWGSRIPGWAIDNLVDAANLLSYPGALAAAGAGVARFEQLEIQGGMHGYHLDPGSSTPDTSPWMDNIFFIGAARYVMASGDHSHDAFLQRMRTWFRNSCLVPATGTLQAVNLPYVYRLWRPESPQQPSLHLGWPMCEALSYSAYLFNDLADMQTASILFECLTRFHQEPSQGPAVAAFVPSGYSKVTMRPFQYPGTESKILGNILIWGRAHMAFRAYFEGWL